MNSTLMRVIAIILAAGAIITGWLGYRMSTQQAAPQLPTVQITYPQVTAVRDIPAGAILTAADVRVEKLSQRDPGALVDTQHAVGKLTLVAIAKGAPVLTSYLPLVSPVAQTLQTHERALAVKVNEVIGVGGFLKPGDHVDVLLYLRADKETGDVSSAQVVLGNVRVLAYGDDAEPVAVRADSAASESSLIQQGASKLETMKAQDGKSAILAVPEHETARLMLAENSGIIKLALRGATLPGAARTMPDRHFVQLQNIGKPAAEPVLTPVANASVPKITKTARTADSQVIVHHGDRVEVVKLKP